MPDYTLTICVQSDEAALPYVLGTALRQIADEVTGGMWSGGKPRMMGGYSTAWELSQDRPWPADDDERPAEVAP